jgi:hypothetical protein
VANDQEHHSKRIIRTLFDYVKFQPIEATDNITFSDNGLNN